MKREDLFEAIGSTEDDLLEDSAAYRKKRSILPALVGIAACLAVGILGYRALPKKDLRPEQKIIEIPVTETVYYNAGSPENTETTESQVSTTGQETVEKPPAFTQSGDPYPGIWYARALGDDAENFYCFREDGSGSIRNAKTGEATDFTYEGTPLSEAAGTALHLQMNDAQYDAVFTDAEKAIYLSWDPDGRSEQLCYVGAEDGFRFYTDAELCEMVGKVHGLKGDPYELAEFDLVPSAFPKVVVCVTAGEWRGHWYYTADRLTGEVVSRSEK